MNIPDIVEVNEKKRRVMDFFENSGYEAMVIGRLDNFAWFTCGGDSRVLTTSEKGFALLVIIQEKIYVIAHTMDGPRVIDEELNGLDFEPVILKWYEAGLEEKATELIADRKAVGDIRVEGVKYSPQEIYSLHYPLTEKEVGKCRWIGEKSEEIIRKVADEIQPGLTEYDIQAMLLYEYGRHDIMTEVILIGSDERISKYRHPVPSGKKIEKLVMLHPAVRKWGLHANITRMMYFGDNVPEDLERKYDVLNNLQAATLSMCIPGQKFSRIFDVRKELLKRYGFDNEWEYHFAGAVTGYFLCDTYVCVKPEAVISINQPFDWFITITGAKVEELSIATLKGPAFLSVTGKWPVKEYEYSGQSFRLPEILLK